jgi:hypothetical protein
MLQNLQHFYKYANYTNLYIKIISSNSKAP